MPDGERKRTYLTDFALKDLKNDLDQVMREVDELENPDGSYLNKQWNEKEDGDKLGELSPLKHGYEETYDDKVVLSVSEHRLLTSRLETLALEVSDMKLKLEDRDSQIYELRHKLDQERKNARWTKTDKVKRVMQRNDLEEFFMECVEEVRKDIVKRRAHSAANGIAAKKHSIKNGKTIEEDQDGPKLDQYTATDKRRVIELLMSNENVLLFLYEKLFPAV